MDKSEKALEKFNCSDCNFKCRYNCDWDRHITTEKHKKRVNDETEQESIKKEYKCVNCNKAYNERSGLWKHSKICKPEQHKDKDVIIKQSQLIELIKETAEMKKILTEQIENVLILLRENASHSNSE